MATQFRILGPACALLALAALLAAGARADDVTTAECAARGAGARPRLYPTDSDASWLWMCDCGITETIPKIFTGLPQLKGINLSNNNIENINQAVFHTVPALKTLWLDNNKVRELPVFDERSCANWTLLKLSSNKLTVIDNAKTFSACAKLQSLSLNQNGIEFIHPHLFTALTELTHLILNDNKIKLIPTQMFANNGKLRELYLHNNLITHLPPDFASSLRRAGAGFLSFFFHGNPWHCACLFELLVDVQRAGVSEYKYEWGIGTYEGTRPECNYISMREYPCSKIRELNFIVHGVR